MTRIKFCGLTRPADAVYAADLGATYGGVILAASARQVDPARAREIFAGAEGLRRVGVFRQAPPAEILRDARDAEIDVLQLHGRFGAEEIVYLREGFDGELWSVIPMDADAPVISDEAQALIDGVDAVVLDTSVRGTSGGTGVSFDWNLAQPQVHELSQRTTVVLAGGLGAGNVGDAIRILAPAVVDVSSGVEEAPGIKSRAAMRAFADAVRSASIV
jgi:phosphoribosylanthranilate isomerase